MTNITVIGICNECDERWISQQTESDDPQKECPNCGSIPEQEFGIEKQDRVGIDLDEYR